MAMDPFVPGYGAARRTGATFLQMRAQLDDLQRQLATGKKASSFADLGVERRISLDTRSKLGTLDGWTKAIDQGDMRVRFMNQTIENLARSTADAKGDARPGAYVQSANGEVAGQILARDRLSAAIDRLNVEVGGRYLFSGRSHDVKPVETFDLIMNGDGAGRAGVKQLISERQQADAGVGDLGRLTNTVAGASVNIAREVADPPYGYTLRGVTSSTTNIGASFAAGPPASASFTVTANPNAGDKITLALNLPDGTVETIELEARATSSTGPAETGFTIGATPAATAANIGASVTAALQKETRTSLGAASAAIAARDFFNGSTTNQPLRVPGPGFTTTTAPPAAGLPGATVIWYKGDDNAAISARNTSTLQVDDAQVVATGARANEQAFRESLVGFAVFATASFTSADPNSRDRYEAVTDRVRTTLSFSTTQKPQDIAIEISTAQVAMASAKERHKITGNFLETARAGVEDANQEEVIVSLQALQTRLQASYQTTAILSRLTLTSYLS